MPISYEDMQKRQERPEFKPQKRFTYEEAMARNATPDPLEYEKGWGGGKRLLDEAKDVGVRIGELETAVGKPENEAAKIKERNLDVGLGFGKAITSGFLSLAELAVQGYAGIQGAKQGPLLGMSVTEGFTAGVEEMAAKQAKAREIASKITGLNLTPENRQQELAHELLMLLPEGIVALGDTVYEKTGWAVASAGAQALATLLTLKPSVASKSFGAVKRKLAGDKTQTPGSEASADRVAAAFDEMSAKDPETSRAIVEHIAKSDPETGQKLLDRWEEIQVFSEEQLREMGAKAAGRRTLEGGQKKLPGPTTPLLEGPKGAPPAKKLTWDEAFGKPAKAVEAAEVGNLPSDRLIIDTVLEQGKRGEITLVTPAAGSVMSMAGRALEEGKVVLLAADGKAPRRVKKVSELENVSPESVFIAEPFEAPVKPSSSKAKGPKATKKAIAEGKFTRQSLRNAKPLANEYPGLPRDVAISKALERGDRVFIADEIGGAPIEVRSPTDVRGVGDLYVAKPQPITPPPIKPGQEQGVVPKDRVSDLGYNVTKNKQGTFEVSTVKEGKPTRVGEPFPTESMARAYVDELMGKDAQRGKMSVVEGGKATPERVPPAEAKPGQYPTLPSQKAKARAEEGMANATEELAKAADQPAKEDAPPPGLDDPLTYMHLGIPIKLSDLKKAFTWTKRYVPGVAIAEGKLKSYWEAALMEVAPEAIGPDAKRAGATIGSKIAEEHLRAQKIHGPDSKQRRTFFNMRSDVIPEFLRKYEKGEKFDDPLLQKISDFYREWSERLFVDEQKLGLRYEAIDNYIYHLFEDGPAVQRYFEKKYGAGFGDPRFIKERAFATYEEAVANGFKPKFSNPEEIMLARQHAHEVASTRIETLRELEAHGLAARVKKGETTPPDGFSAAPRRSPNGEQYWVHEEANNILHNLWDVKSLWTIGGPGARLPERVAGATFRSAMFLKNTIVPVILNLSGFHGIHVLTIDNATAMVRAAKELIAGKETAAGFMGRLNGAAFYKGIYSNPKMGGRVNRILKGEIPEAEWTAGDKAAMMVMSEGGFVPMLSKHYQTGAIASFRTAWERATGEARRGETGAAAWDGVKAVWHGALSLPQLLQYPMFNLWIPNLKAASYLNDVATAVKVDPTLWMDVARRKETFRKIAKSVDNRYGEMAYDQLFWNRWLRDIGVGASLSLGWNLGFLREYGGAGSDLFKIGRGDSGKTAAEAAAKGDLDRALFVTFYSTQALAYGGLMTYLLTGDQPESMMDYVYPRSGQKNPDGTDQRLNTMHYPREFVSVAKHMETAGVAEGLGETVLNKASPALGMMKAWATGVDSMDREIYDPDAPAFKKVQQALGYTFREMEPITVGSIRQMKDKTPTSTALAFAGFSPAPKYITSSATENRIKHLFIKYHGQKLTPYERAEYSEDKAKLKGAYQQKDQAEFKSQLQEMKKKYQLSPEAVNRMRKSVKSKEDPTIKMFSRLDWTMQKKLLDEMTLEERKKYKPHSNKEHLRNKYRPPREE